MISFLFDASCKVKSRNGQLKSALIAIGIFLFSVPFPVKKHTENSVTFGCNEDQIVSSDIIGTEYGSVFDPTLTQVVSGKDGGQIVKGYAWYDNESGFVAQMIRTLEKVAKTN